MLPVLGRPQDIAGGLHTPSDSESTILCINMLLGALITQEQAVGIAVKLSTGPVHTVGLFESIHHLIAVIHP